MPLQAVNNFVFIIRDESEKESGGLIIPDQGQVKPHHGTIFSIGDLVKDKNIRKGKGKKCLFHINNGWDMEYNDETYLVIEGERIIGVDA